MPLQVSYFFERTIKRKVQYHIIHLQPDHVFCQLIRATPYVRALPFSKTLDYMDVFSLGMRQRAIRFKALGFLFNWEAERLSKYERSIYKDFDHHVVISRQDRDRLALASPEHVVVIPNGVDEQFFMEEKSTRPAFDIVFVGNLGYGPNIEAATFLARSVLPALQATGKMYKLLVAGARPAKQVKALNALENVVVSGWVPDIRQAYGSGRIFVAPMFSGLGLQNKILEAMAMGLPCVTTTMVNNAIGAAPGQQILIGDDLDEIIHQILLLDEHPDLYSRLAEAGRQFVAGHYRWSDQVQKLEEVIQSRSAYSIL